MSSPTPRVRYELLLWPLAAVAGAVISTTITADPYGNPDSRAFEALARNLLRDSTLSYREPTMPGLDLVAYRSPVYSTFLAVALALGGVPAALALQGALAALTACAVGMIGRRIAGAAVGWIAGALVALSPLTWTMAGQLMSETLYTALAVGAVWLGIEAVMRPGRASQTAALTTGLIAALALLARPVGVALLGPLGVWLLWRRPAAAVLMLATALLAWAPWPARNAQRLGAFVPLLTSGGINAWNGHTGRPIGEGWAIQSGNAALGEVGLDRMFWRMAAEESRSQPRVAVARALRRAWSYVVPLGGGRDGLVHRLAWPLAVIGALVAFAARPPWRGTLVLPAAVWAGHAILGVLTVVNERYRAPTDWVVFLVAACGVQALRERFGPARGAWLAGGIAVASSLLMAALRPWI